MVNAMIRHFGSVSFALSAARWDAFGVDATINKLIDMTFRKAIPA